MGNTPTWITRWSGSNYVISLLMGSKKITIHQYYDGELINQWQEAYNLKTNTGYTVEIVNNYAAQEISLHIVEKGLDDAGQPVEYGIFNSTLKKSSSN